MQIVDKKNIEKRILYYWSKMYTKTIKSGDNYNELEKSIIILITDYNLEKLYEIEEYITKWNIREEKHAKLILTDVLEIYIIELNKVSSTKPKENNTLNMWLQFINNPKEKLFMENEGIKKAKKVLEEISQDEREQRLTELREKYILDQNAVFDKGYELGIKDIAKRLKEKNINIGEIAEITKLTEEEIEKL